MTWDEFAGDEPEEAQEPDAYELSARDELAAYFDSHRSSVFFANQLAIIHERRFFHWVTYRAIKELLAVGEIRTELRKLTSGAEIKLLWHKSHRYYRRDATRVVALVDEYAGPNIGAAIGLHGEQMVLAGFARRQFVMRDHNSRQFGGMTWEQTQHNIDFIFERDGIAYGVEVKNMLSYMDQRELYTKIALCEHLQVRPVFAARMLPKNWIHDLVERGGYAMILGFQLYPWTHVDLARRVAKELSLPVDAPRALADGTMDKFERWHERNVNSKRNSRDTSGLD
jgi:hypothetical protein